MDSASPLATLGQCLAGVFQNREQALAEPAWFVHLRLWSYPVPLFQEDSVTFFLEQASAAFPQPPYRQRVLRLRSLADKLEAEYYALKQPSIFQGAAQTPDRLRALTEADVLPLVNSRLQVSWHPKKTPPRFEARQYPGQRCQFSVNGETKVVDLGFDAIVPFPESKELAAFWMYDKGIDPDTGRGIWGALQGPFRLQKTQDFSAALVPPNLAG